MVYDDERDGLRGGERLELVARRGWGRCATLDGVCGVAPSGRAEVTCQGGARRRGCRVELGARAPRRARSFMARRGVLDRG
jgi:hypothetical protein